MARLCKEGYIERVRHGYYQLAVYARERTVCDCFKYRTKLDNEMFNKALNAYAADKKKNLSNLSSLHG